MSVTGKLYSTIYNAFRHGKISLLILTQDLKFCGVNDESNKQTNTLAISRSQWNKILSNRTITIIIKEIILLTPISYLNIFISIIQKHAHESQSFSNYVILGSTQMLKDTVHNVIVIEGVLYIRNCLQFPVYKILFLIRFIEKH